MVEKSSLCWYVYTDDTSWPVSALLPQLPGMFQELLVLLMPTLACQAME